MLKITKICIFKVLILILGCLASANAEANEMQNLDTRQPIAVQWSMPVVNIQLPANPSTGYRWVVIQYDRTLMDAPTSHYLAPHSDLVGAPGYTVWQFKFKKSAFAMSQTTAVVLEYKRPWEKESAAKRIIRINIQKK